MYYKYVTKPSNRLLRINQFSEKRKYLIKKLLSWTNLSDLITVQFLFTQIENLLDLCFSVSKTIHVIENVLENVISRQKEEIIEYKFDCRDGMMRGGTSDRSTPILIFPPRELSRGGKDCYSE